MTLHDVALACTPPTTAQTIGRLETGTRTVSVAWLNRIAAALGVAAADLVRLPDQATLPVAALLDRETARAPSRAEIAPPPQVTPALVALRVVESVGDYRAGDVVWCERIAADRVRDGLNRDVLAPRPAGRFVFGRLIGIEEDRLLVLPPAAGARQIVVARPAWIAAATRLVRTL